jgi:hypothetical protein
MEGVLRELGLQGQEPRKLRERRRLLGQLLERLLKQLRG